MGQASDVAAAAKSIRRKIVQLAADTRSSHVGCALSMTDVLTYLLEVQWQSDDRLVLSKGHAAIGLYAALNERGLLDDLALRSYHQDGSPLVAHPSHLVPGVDVSTGSLGHGPAVAAGLAVGMHRQGMPGRVYCILGDGECQEGSVWEALLVIARLKPPNLTLIVDSNGYQGFSDPTNDLLPVDRLVAMLTATGLTTVEIDGHDLDAIHRVLGEPLDSPKIVIAHTIKGKGVSFMENRFEWHYLSPDPEQLALALLELS